MTALVYCKVFFLERSPGILYAGYEQSARSGVRLFLNSTPGGGRALKTPPLRFSSVVLKRLKISRSYLVTFPKHSLAHIWVKKNGQVRSGHQSRSLDPPKKSG